MKKFLLTIVIVVVAGGGMVYGQDLHFSQYFNAPLLVNPANTGFDPNADYRIGVNYRNQWASVMNNPYKTFSAWGDVQAFGNQFDDAWIGIGGVILRDAAGAGSLTSTKAYASVAYHQVLGLNSLISLGFNAGWVNKKIDFSKLSFDNQWNGQFFDNKNIPSNENFAYDQVNYLDVSLGANYAYFPTDNIYINGGLSAMHINRPVESFFDASKVDTRLSVRYNAFLNALIKLNDNWILNPNVYYSQMASAKEMVAGMNAAYNLSGDGAMQVIGGIYMRSDDAVIPMLGYQWGGMKLTVSYDATISALGSYNNSRGAYEFSLVKAGVFGAQKAVKCPTVTF